MRILMGGAAPYTSTHGSRITCASCTNALRMLNNLCFMERVAGFDNITALIQSWDQLLKWFCMPLGEQDYQPSPAFILFLFIKRYVHVINFYHNDYDLKYEATYQKCRKILLYSICYGFHYYYCDIFNIITMITMASYYHLHTFVLFSFMVRMMINTKIITTNFGNLLN